MKILILEDEDILRKVLTRTLQNAGFQVTSASCIRDAAAALENNPVDLILSDIGLPDGNGLDFLKESRERFPEISGIVMTAQNSQENQMASEKIGVREFFTKPVCLKDLKTAIYQLDCRRANRDETILEDGPLLIEAVKPL